MRYFFSGFCIFLCCAFVRVSFAADNFSFSFYGQSYTVSIPDVEGTDITFKQAQPYIPKVFPDMRKDKGEPVDVMDLVNRILVGYEHLYLEGVGVLANRILEYLPDEKGGDVDALILELSEAFQNGTWKNIADRYTGDYAFLGPHVLEVQQLHLKYVACLYVFNMLVASPEMKQAFEMLDVSGKDSVE